MKNQQKITRQDKALIDFLGNFRVLTVNQLAAISQRSKQVIRRRLRALSAKGLISTKDRSFGNKRGRPESVLFLTENGWRYCLGGRLKKKQLKDEYSVDPIFIEHELLVNWFFIHLFQIERAVPSLSIKLLTQHLAIIGDDHGGGVQVQVRGSINNREKEHSEFIPDGIFAAANADLKKSLLFFLEVDMGSETVVSLKRDSKDIRQKIINYQALFKTRQYKRYEKIFSGQFNGFRLLFVTNSRPRLNTLCRFVREIRPSDFIWLTDQDRMFSKGLADSIWARGGRLDDPPQSILGPKLACPTPVVDKVR